MDEQQTPPKPPGFWKRQFSDEVTRPQIIFDVLAGAVIPFLLIIFDPIVFRQGFQPSCHYIGILTKYMIFAYLAVGLGIPAFLIWFIRNASIPSSYLPVAAGIMFVGGFLALGIGLWILPFTIIFISTLISILGLFPFVTAFAYLRNGVRARRRALQLQQDRSKIQRLMWVGALGLLAIPVAAQLAATLTIRLSIDTIADQTSTTDDAAAIKNLVTVNKICFGMCTAWIAEDLRAETVPPNALYMQEEDRNVQVDRAFDALAAADPVFYGCNYLPH